MAKNLKQRLLIGFSIVVVTMAVMIGVVLYSIFHFSSLMDRLVTEDITELSTLNDLKSAMVNQSHAALDYYAGPQKPELFSELQGRDQRIRSLLKQLFSVSSGAETINQLTDGYDGYWKKYNVLLKERTPSNTERVKGLGKDLRALAIIKINELIDEENKEIKGIASKGRGDLAFAIPVLLGLILATLILSVLISVRITDSVTRPIDQLVKTTQQMNEGDLSARSQIKSNDEIGQLSQSFDEMAASLERLFNEQKSFLADASHELKTPLTVIQGYAEVAMLSPEVRSNSDVLNTFEGILSVTSQMKRIVNDLLFLSRSSLGKLPMEEKEVELQNLLEKIQEDAKILAQMKNISFKLETEPAVIMGDESRLRQVFFILLDNAIKFTPSGGTIGVSTHKEDGKARLSFTDTGTGIPEKDIPYIFDRFYQVDRSRSREGAGLGLAIAKVIIESHQGHVTVESQPGKGTRFNIDFPLKEAT